MITQIRLVNRGSRSISAWAHLGLQFGFALLFFLFLTGHGVLAYLEKHVLGVVPEHELTVSIKKKDVAFFRVVEPGDKDHLQAADLAALEKLDGIRSVMPLTYGNHPSSALINFMGQKFSSEMVIQGFPPEWVYDDVPAERLEWEPGKIVPIVISSQLLSIFNNGYAASQGLPNLSANAVMAPIWNLSYGPRKSIPTRLQARIVGVSPKVALGAAIPQNVLDYLHQTHNLPAPSITEAVLYLDGNINTDDVRKAVADLGYVVDEPHPMARIFQQIKGLGTAAAVLLLGCICLFGFAFLNQTLKMLFLVKQHDYAICRALGMSRTFLRLILCLETGMMLLLDLAFGLGLGYMAGVLFNNQLLSGYLERLVGLPLALQFPWPIVLATSSIVLVLGLAVLLPRILASTAKPVGEFLNRS